MILRFFLTALLICSISACGGSSGSDDNPTGVVNIAITDAAVDAVTAVVVEFSGVTLKPQDGQQVEIMFDTPKSINLLDLRDGRTEALLPDTRFAAGRYNWVRLGVNAEFDNVRDSYVITDKGEEFELRVPSGSQSGLKLVSGFTVTQGRSTNLVIDWDLRKALSNPKGQPGMHLRPALRVTDMAAYGTLSGAIDPVLTTADECGEDSTAGNAVYLYENSVDGPEDIRGAETDPIATATPRQDLSYQISYLSVGTYTAAFTCQADIDDAEQDDEIVFAVVVADIAIVDGQTTVVDFAAPTP